MAPLMRALIVMVGVLILLSWMINAITKELEYGSASDGDVLDEA